MICHLHYKPAPCDDCAAHAFLRRVFPPVEAAVGLSAPTVITFKPNTWDNIYHPWETPRELDTPQALREECESRGMYSEYLRDSSLWRTPSRRWV